MTKINGIYYYYLPRAGGKRVITFGIINFYEHMFSVGQNGVEFLDLAGEEKENVVSLILNAISFLEDGEKMKDRLLSIARMQDLSLIHQSYINCIYFLDSKDSLIEHLSQNEYAPIFIQETLNEYLESLGKEKNQRM